MRGFTIKSQLSGILTQRKHTSLIRFNQQRSNNSQFAKKRNFSAQYFNISKKFNIKFIIPKTKSIKQAVQTNRKTPKVLPSIRTNHYKPTHWSNWDAFQEKKDTQRQITMKQDCQIDRSLINSMQQKASLVNYQSKMLPKIQQQIQQNVMNNKINDIKSGKKLMELTFNWKQKYYVLTINHFRSFFDLKEALQDQVAQSQLVILLKKALVLYQHLKQPQKEDLEGLFPKENERKQIRRLICIQMSILIGVLDCIMRGDYVKIVKQDSKRIMESIIGVYYYMFISALSFESQKADTQRSSKGVTKKKILLQMQLYCQWMENLGYHIKKDLSSNNLFIYLKLSMLFRKNCDLLSSIKQVFKQANQVPLKQTYYSLLSSFALYLNFHQKMLENFSNLLIQFATSPAPYLTNKCNKKYTLVVDLHTVVSMVKQKGTMKIKYRNHCDCFFKVLSQFCQIILFTLQLPGSINTILRDLEQIDYCLYRPHATREKHFNRKLSEAKYSFLKDLSRIGRPMNKIIGIDADNLNMRLQPQNCIQIGPCKRNSNDNHLQLLCDFIVQLAKCGTQDVRQKIKMFHMLSN